MKFNFPKTRFVDEANWCKQIEHLKSEIAELELANNPEEQAEEVIDVFHSAETLVRLYINHGPYLPKQIEEIKKKVIQKNRERGYYD